MFGRLMVFVLFLIPGFIQFATYYARAPIKNISYHPEGGSRNLLDIYPLLSPPPKTGAPVVVFLTGGAWIIGYKMWGALLGRALSSHGVLLVVPDYRNFPQTDVQGMMSDVDLAVKWVLQNISEYGGDPSKVVLVGQSAGAHLGSMVMLVKAAAAARSESLNLINDFSFTSESGVDFDVCIDKLIEGDDTDSNPNSNPEEGDGLRTNWLPTDLCGFVPISGPYHLPELADHFQSRGLDRRIIDWIFQADLEKYSPTVLARNLNQSSMELGRFFPPVVVVHGDRDASAPVVNGIGFRESLVELGIEADMIVYEGMTHTDPIIEKPMAGEQQLHKDVYELVRLWTGGGGGKFDEDHPLCRRLLPQVCIEIGRWANPF